MSQLEKIIEKKKEELERCKRMHQELQDKFDRISLEKGSYVTTPFQEK